jgi:hypothetical protein
LSILATGKKNRGDTSWRVPSEEIEEKNRKEKEGKAGNVYPGVEHWHANIAFRDLERFSDLHS